MKKCSLVGLLIIVLAVESLHSQEIASQVFYQRLYDRVFDLNFRSSSARNTGMGNAFLAMADNVDAIGLNPAGLAQLIRPQANLVGQFNFDMRDYYAPEFSGTKILSEVPPQLLFQAGAAAFPFQVKNFNIVPGISYRFLYNITGKFDETQYFYGGGLFSEEKELSGGPMVLSPALAISLLPQIQLGFSYNKIMGSSKYVMNIKSPWFDDTVYFGFEDREEYSGSYLEFGALIKPIRFISLGVAFTPGWNYKIKETREFFRVLEYDYILGEMEEIYETAPEDLDEFTVEVPLSYQLGLAIHPIRQISLAVSYENKTWEDAKILLAGQEQPNFLVNVESFNTGFEYRIEYGLWEVPLRLGYFTNNLPVKDKWFEDSYLGEQIERDFYTFGFGVYYDHYMFDFAFQYSEQSNNWWMKQSDYYNYRLFETKDMFNQALFSFAYRL